MGKGREKEGGTCWPWAGTEVVLKQLEPRDLLVTSEDHAAPQSCISRQVQGAAKGRLGGTAALSFQYPEPAFSLGPSGRPAPGCSRPHRSTGDPRSCAVWV